MCSLLFCWNERYTWQCDVCMNLPRFNDAFPSRGFCYIYYVMQQFHFLRWMLLIFKIKFKIYLQIRDEALCYWFSHKFASFFCSFCLLSKKNETNFLLKWHSKVSFENYMFELYLLIVHIQIVCEMLREFRNFISKRPGN